jgi:hypothetical protein
MATWLEHPIADEAHAKELERLAAHYEFDWKLPREEAEARAYREYSQRQHAEAAAHHLRMADRARNSGYPDEGRLHYEMYRLHAKRLGEPHGQASIPPAVQAHLSNQPGEDPKPYRYAPHWADDLIASK